ncbi:MAG: alpha/beta fold hydrolase BchO [Pseudomonadota bacterium]
MRWGQINTWPNAHLSRRIVGPVHRWHVQETGEGPTLLLLHGAGGSTHSYRDLLDDLAKAHHVIALDLPGQGFTQLGARHRCGLDAMAADIAKLCVQEGWKPVAIVGHSAGGAVAFRLGQILPGKPAVIGINAALVSFSGLAGVLFPAMAKILATLPFAATLFSGASDNPERIKALIDSTGSVLNAEGLDLYRRLVADKAHVDGTLLMMAQWSLDRLLRDLEGFDRNILLIAGTNDKTVPYAISEQTASRMKNADLVLMESYGHLAHEEEPAEVANNIIDYVSGLPQPRSSFTASV